MPPPKVFEHEFGAPAFGGHGPVCMDRTLFAVTMLALIVTLLPDSTAIPPPAGSKELGYEVFLPPVTVAPETDTAGPLAESRTPTVMTGPLPCPRITVDFAPAPCNFTLVRIV